MEYDKLYFYTGRMHNFLYEETDVDKSVVIVFKVQNCQLVQRVSIGRGRLLNPEFETGEIRLTLDE